MNDNGGLYHLEKDITHLFTLYLKRLLNVRVSCWINSGLNVLSLCGLLENARKKLITIVYAQRLIPRIAKE
jgi:hypothetical protein